MCSNQEFTTVEPYSSGSESESDESTNEQPGGPEEPNHRRQNLVWLFTQQFETADIALDWIVEQKIWTKRREYATDAGDKVFYRCNRVKRRSRRQCAHAVLLQYNSGDDAVNLFETPEEHDHDQINITSTRQGINEPTKAYIKHLLSLGVLLPKQILQNIEKEQRSNPAIKVPLEKQLYNHLSIKKDRVGSCRMKFSELSKYCKENTQLPTEKNKPFVVSYQINIDDEDDEMYPVDSTKIQIEQASFRMVITSQRLLEIASKATIIQADSTYKLIWNGFPVLIIGTSDADKVFHPFLIAICTNETQHDFHFVFNSLQIGLKLIGKTKLANVSLLADAADAITNGFKATFYPNTSSFKRGMCWFHMQKAVSNRLCILDENQLEKLILIDINALQLTSSNRLFEAAVKLFVEKWKRHINVSINSFLEYFQDEWVDHHCGWYEGYLPDGPSTNNGLEGTNGTIKTEHTFRKRVSLATFLLKANEIVETWSNKRDSASANNPKLVVTEPIKKLKFIFILSTKRVILWYHF